VKRLLFALLAVASVTLGAGLSVTPAQAQSEPAWCAYSSGAGGMVQCAYATLEQCKASIGGLTGYCQPNPRLTANASMRRPVRH